MAREVHVTRPHGLLIKLTELTAAFTFTIPRAYAIRNVYGAEIGGNAVTGGLKIGTTDGGTEVIAAQTVAASTLFDVADTALLKRFFSQADPTILYADAVTAWNSAQVELFIDCAKLR